MVNPDELLDAVVDRDTFIAFASALATEREAAEGIERANPVAYHSGPKPWFTG